MPSEKAMQLITEWENEWPDKPIVWEASEARLRLLQSIDTALSEARDEGLEEAANSLFPSGGHTETLEAIASHLRALKSTAKEKTE